MRRATSVVAVCLCAASACRGGAAQEPEGSRVAGRAPSAATAERIASEVDVRRAIAFVSDERPRAVKRARPVGVVERASPPPTRVIRESDGESDGDVHVVLHDPAEHEVDAKPAVEGKPAAPKACSGVVNRRS